MYANYHTHTWRCRHASGTEKQYIEQAIASGTRILGFADHTPYPFPDGHNSTYRMFLYQAEDYFQTLSDLKREYAGQIELHIGVEAEYYPLYFSDLLALLRQYPCEYMLLGQHFLGNEEAGPYIGHPFQDADLLRHYVDQVLCALRTGHFIYLAHPDLPNWQGDRETYVQEMTRLCRSAKELGYPLELNLLGLYGNRNYPCETFWQIAGTVGNEVILGADAHVPEALNRPEVEARAKALAGKFGLHVLDRLDL